MRKKVLFLVNHDVVIYNFRKELVERLLLEGYEVIISSPNGPRIDKLIEMGCKFEEIKISRHGTNVLEDFKLLKNYNKLIKKINPDVILTYTIKPNIYGSIAARKYDVPIIANITGLGNGFNNKAIKTKLLISLYKYAFQNNHKIFFQNLDNLKYLNSKISIKEKSQLLPGSGVNLKEYKYQRYPNNARLSITYFGRIMRSKGMLEYLEAIEILNRKYPNVKYNFIGFFENNDFKSTFVNYCNKNNNIKYFKHVEDVKPFIKGSEAIILPSHHEGMSNSLLEAAASGRPLLASNIPGCKEIVEDGKNGFLFEPKSVDSLVTAIENFLNLSFKERKKMGEYSRMKVEKEFDRNIVVNEYIKVIDSILGGEER